MSLMKWNAFTRKMVGRPVVSTPASRPEVQRGVYCPQNRWGTVDFGVDAKVGFAHVKEGADGQLAGLTTMLTELTDHKSADKVNAFACGSVMSTRDATRFRSRIQRAVKSAGIRNFDFLYSDVNKCPAWLVVVKQLTAEQVIGTAGITSCIGVVAWAPTTLEFEVKHITFDHLAELDDVTLQLPDTTTLDEVDLNDQQFKP